MKSSGRGTNGSLGAPRSPVFVHVSKDLSVPFDMAASGCPPGATGALALVHVDKPGFDGSV